MNNNSRAIEHPMEDLYEAVDNRQVMSVRLYEDIEYWLRGADTDDETFDPSSGDDFNRSEIKDWLYDLLRGNTRTVYTLLPFAFDGSR